jgi:alpha-mannosidase
MIGNSHIDPVWCWSREEGMQAVKATFSSVLDRLREYPDFIFTTTSAAFFAWIERIQPDLFREIQQRVAEGRWELTDGWCVEPDCIIPSGEAFARQGLYTQRYFMSRFGAISHIGSNVDSFGHGSSRLDQRLSLHADDAFITLAHALFWDEPCHQPRFVPPTTFEQTQTRTESIYGTTQHATVSDFEYHLHRRLDVYNPMNGAGLLVTNTNTNAFWVDGNQLELTILRRPVHAQHKSTTRHNPLESYQNANLGEHTFTWLLFLHGGILPNHHALQLADPVAKPITTLFDNQHAGNIASLGFSFAQVDVESVRIELVKKAEDDPDFIFMVWETAWKDTTAVLTSLGALSYHPTGIYVGNVQTRPTRAVSSDGRSA